MRFLELYFILLVVNINYNLPPTQGYPRTTILCKMSAERIQHGRTRWTERMCVDLLTCKDEAKQLHTSEECPTNEKGRKIGLMQLTLKFWNEKGYESLGKTAQNLRDKLSHLEKTCKVNALRITNEIREQRETGEQRPNNSELGVQDQSSEDQSSEQPSEQQQNIDWTNEDLNRIAQITQAAKCIFDDIVTDTGNMQKRDVNTFVKKNNYIKKKDLDRLQHSAKSLIKASPADNPLQYFWEYNCAIYSVVKAWKSIHSKEKNANKERKNGGKPRWMANLERKMNYLRKQISQICEEIKRLRVNRKLTPRMKKNRSWMAKETKGKINIECLTTLKERKINSIRALKRQKENKKAAYERFKTNQWFDVDEGSFYNHLNNIIKSTESNECPQYTGRDKPAVAQGADSTSAITKEEFEEFWRPIWENASELSTEEEWIKDTETALKQQMLHPTESITITKEVITNSIKHKRNWSSPGTDKITNYWIKKMDIFHKDIATALNIILTERLEIPSWLTTGRSVMIPKKDNATAADHRPITCLNTLYKLITSVIDYQLKLHVDKNDLMQIDQRGGKAKSMGTVDNLLIDKMILEDAHFRKKNLSCTWVDVKKAFDSVSHQWVAKTLEMHGINADLIHLITSVMKTWNINLEVTTNQGKETIGPIKVNRGILQGDSFCVCLFTLSLNPIAWYLRSTEGYKLSHAPDRKITHVLFVDDLKTYHRSEQKAATVASKLKKMFTNIGLEWGINKCAAIHMKRGKLNTNNNNTNGMPVSNNCTIPVIGSDDHYKFLGKYQNTEHLEDKVIEEASKEYEKRLWTVWTSPLSIPRKVRATNTYAVPVLQYYMWTTDWCLNHLKELDRLTRKVINDCSGKHKYESTPLLYLQPEQGGKGLIELETLYKNTKLKVANYINNSTDQNIKLVKSFHLEKEQRNLRSIFKDAKKYAEDLSIECSFNNNETVLKINEKEVRTNSAEPQKVKNIIHIANVHKHKKDLQQQPWIGKFVNQHWNDPEISRSSYDLFKHWKNIPDVVLSVDTLIRQQLLNTRTYRKHKLQEHVEELTCRICLEKQETATHILANCSHLAQTLYSQRHDKMLRPIYHALLDKYGLEQSDYSSPWYKQSIPQPSEENDEVKILWNIPWHLKKAPRNGSNKPDISVLDKKAKECILIEGTVCTPGTIPDRTKNKQEKYVDLRLGIKYLYPGFKVSQINVVFDYLGAHHKELNKDLSKLFGTQVTNLTIERSQKWIISQNCEIVKRFMCV